MALQLYQLPLAHSLSSTSSSFSLHSNSLFFHPTHQYTPSLNEKLTTRLANICLCHNASRRRKTSNLLAGKEDIELSVQEQEEDQEEEEEEEEAPPPSPQDLQYVQDIKRVLEILRKNRDMLFSEVKLTITIEDPREVERRKLLGIDDADAPTRDDLAEALEQVNEGKVPKNRVALQMLAEEMINWPNLEVEAPKAKPSKSLYAKATDTGIDPKEAAKRLKVDWDSAAEIEDADMNDETEVPPAMLVTKEANSFAGLWSTILGLRFSNHHCTAEHFHELKFVAIEESNRLIGKEGMEKEKQISVDPISLRESSRREASFNFMLPPVSTAPTPDLLSPVLPSKSQLITCSLPNSICSSPRFSFTMLKKKWKNESHASPRQIDNMAGRHSSAHAPLAARQEIRLQRSKSCAEGRTAAPADELDLWFTRPNASRSDDGPHGHFVTDASQEDHITGENMDPIDDGFKCGALCLYLPGFAKGKPVRPKKEEVKADLGNVLSRTVSLEKFECGSWASSAIINDHEDDSMNLYFDLPLELIQTNSNYATSPVAAAFLFDKDRKGVLRSCSTRAAPRKSHESSRHVRFSTSSATSHPTSPTSCITPRLRKAREDFNAYLEAQSA
ncbi:unnamed protein product [Dovyalis caffra]|uniref:Uncharacterized protein n=1 Tax=Dovyalis caffra TaxID=77055 RepID=A0AAV1RJQ1_9ROSI|nr:unnamed protein product [Dovyalis caffra]